MGILSLWMVIEMNDMSKLHVSKQYYMNGEVLYLPNSDYVLLRLSGIEPFPSMLYALGSACIGTYAIIDAKTGRVVCTREILDYDLKILGYKACSCKASEFSEWRKNNL